MREDDRKLTHLKPYALATAGRPDGVDGRGRARGATLTAVARTMPVANTVPLKAVCALEEVADSCVTDLRAKATQRSVASARLREPPRALWLEL